MNFYWTGMAAELERFGDASMTWLLEEIAAGQILAAGHAGAGKTVPVLLSCSGPSTSTSSRPAPPTFSR